MRTPAPTTPPPSTPEPTTTPVPDEIVEETTPAPDETTTPPPSTPAPTPQPNNTIVVPELSQGASINIGGLELPMWSVVVVGVSVAGVGVGTFTCYGNLPCSKRPPIPGTSTEAKKKRIWKLDKLKSLLGASKELVDSSLGDDPGDARNVEETDGHLAKRTSIMRQSVVITSEIVRKISRRMTNISTKIYNVLDVRILSIFPLLLILLFLFLLIIVIHHSLCLPFPLPSPSLPPPHQSLSFSSLSLVSSSSPSPLRDYSTFTTMP
jgi:hypothetical protein